MDTSGKNRDLGFGCGGSGGPAFPQHDTDARGFVTVESGMTLRDYIAIKAMQAELTGVPFTERLGTPEDRSERAYREADAMLKARGR